ncbi:MAG: beta-ketoacyl-[acyl-carrier-protein] synthase family protein [Chthoniobacteraceae bacterium]|jgi:3-oxoacyl-[acyl-carrier-protein] synthase II
MSLSCEMPHARRSVITGIGVIAPNGQDNETFWNSIRLGKSAACPVTRFDVSHLPNKIAAEIKGFDVGAYVDAKKARRFDLSAQYGIAASVRAVRDAGLKIADLDPDRVGVVEGTSVSGMESTFKGQTAFLSNRGYRAMSPFTLINAYSGGGSGEIAIELGIHGLAVSYSSGSASGNDVIGYAANLIRGDEVDVVVVGGTEAPLLAPLYGAFCLTRVMSARNDQPQQAMRPFDKTHDGFVLGEGAAFLVLEELSHAQSRGAKIYAEILGHGRSCEAYHSVAPHPEGVGMRRAIEKALRDARLHYSQVDYVNLHGTATETSDRVESLALERTLNDHAYRVAVSSTKPVTGHLLAAAGALETAVCALAIKHQEIPMTVNFREPAEGCDLDYVPNTSRPYPVRVALNCNVGFGGKNSCLVLKEYKG